MITENKIMKIGSRIRLKNDLVMYHKTYKKGHEFNIIDQSEHGFDLEDDNGNKVLEIGLVQHLFELI